MKHSPTSISWKTVNVAAHSNFKLEIRHGLKMNSGSRELLWPTVIGIFSGLNFSSLEGHHA